MRRRSLGDRDVTSVGCGDVSLAIAANRGVDAREVERAVHEALELGVSVVDVHAEPDAERLVGDAIRGQRARDRVTVATQIPVLAARPGAPRRDVLPERLPARYVQERVEASLRASRLEVLPLAQLPLRSAWRSSAAWPELAGTCARLIREGKVLAWGAILEDLDDDAPGLATEPWLAALHVTYNLCERAAEALLPAAAERKIAVLARRPLAGGALTGNLGPGVRLPPRDDRHALEPGDLERIAVTVARLAPLVRTEPPAARSCDLARAVLERGRRPEQLECTTVAELALRFVIDHGVIALPRLHRHAHVPDALAAAAAPPLSAALLATLTER